MSPRILSSVLPALLGGASMASLAGAQSSPLFPTSTFVTSQQDRTGIVSADFNADGLPDLAICEAAHLLGPVPPDDVAILLSAGGGRFQPQALYPSGWRAQDIAAGDIDGDGDIDLVLSHFEGPGTMVLLNDGLGRFPDSIALAHDWVVALALGDLDGNGALDIVGLEHISGPMEILLLFGLGDGRFTPQRRLPLPGGSGGGDVALGDLDLDGDLDLVATAGAQVFTLIGDGAGHFAVSPPHRLPATTRSIRVNDLDADGDLDLLAAGGSEGFVLLTGDGQGSWLAGRFVPAPVGIGRVEVHDLDADGTPDLVGVGDGCVVRLLGDGTGGFVEPRAFWLHEQAWLLALADFDADQRVDVATTSYGANGVTILWGRGRGEFHRVEPLPLRGEWGPVELGDVDGDGLPDLIVSVDDEVDVLLGTGKGTFQPAIKYPTGGAPPDYEPALALGDLDVDGWMDLLVTRSDGVALLLGLGGGALARPALVLAAQDAAALVLDDLQGDGHDDLVVADGGQWPGDPGALLVALGLGQGAFGPARRLRVGDFPGKLASGDLDGDGHPDLAVSCRYEVRVLRGLGDGRFVEIHRHAVALPRRMPVALADVDGDGALDLLVAAEALEVLHGDGQGGLGRLERFGTGPVPWKGWSARGLRTGDLDGDGDLDVVVDHNGGFAALLLNAGSGRLELVQDLAPASTVTDSALGDLDLDGDLDLVVTDRVWHLGAAYLNRTVQLD